VNRRTLKTAAEFRHSIAAKSLLARLFMNRMAAKSWTILFQLQAFGTARFFLGAIIPITRFSAF
jgi:hypothetical protein